jgi:hypothetical protein
VAAFDMPAAALLNHAGKYVTPSLASMTAAVDDMTVSSNGITEDDSENASNPDAYPLTMVVYAMVPTSGISHSKAAKIAQWLDFAAGAGQTPGVQSGQLPAGYLPLPAKMRAETVKVANEVRNQTGTKASNPGGSGTKTPGSSPSKSASPSPSTGASSGPPASKVNASYSSPDSTGFGRMVVPILLVLGALLALAGPSAVVLGRPGGRAAVIAGWRRIQSLSLRGRK